MGRGKAARILKWLAIVVALLLAGLLAAGLMLQRLATRERVAAALERALGREVSLEAAAARLLAPVPSLFIRGLRVFDRAAVPGDAAGAGNEAWLEVPELEARARLLPLLSGRLELRGLVLRRPEMRLVLFADGGSNLGFLLAGGRTAGPLHAAELPLALSLRGVALEDGTIVVEDRGSGRATRLDAVRLELPRLEIDPRRLDERNGGAVQAGFRLLSSRQAGRAPAGGFAAFDLRLQAAGRVRPFSPRSGALDPRIECRLDSPQGSLSGIRALARVNELIALAGYGGARVPEDISWERAAVEVAYEAGRLELRNGSISGQEADVSFAGTCATDAGRVELEVGVRLAPGFTPAWRSAIRSGAERLLPSSLRRAVDPGRIADAAMTSLAGKDGRVFLKFVASGGLGRPSVRLIEPRFPPLADLARAAAREYLEARGGGLLRRGLDLLRPH